MNHLDYTVHKDRNFNAYLKRLYDILFVLVAGFWLSILHVKIKKK
jgi:uncharacterized membrane protein YccF (DUF307 family)